MWVRKRMACCSYKRDMGGEGERGAGGRGHLLLLYEVDNLFYLLRLWLNIRLSVNIIMLLGMNLNYCMSIASLSTNIVVGYYTYQCGYHCFSCLLLYYLPRCRVSYIKYDTAKWEPLHNTVDLISSVWSRGSACRDLVAATYELMFPLQSELWLF